MKTISIAQAKANLEAVLGSAQKEQVIVTRDGRPSAVLLGIEAYDDEDLQLATSEDFWRMIEERRQGQSITLSELRSRLKLQMPRGAKKKSSSAKRGVESRSGRKNRKA